MMKIKYKFAKRIFKRTILIVCMVLVVQSPTTDDVKESQNGNKTTEAKKQTENESQLKMSFPPQVLHTFLVAGVQRCFHISFMTSEQVWVSDESNLVLTNTAGKTLDHIKGIHADEDNLFYSTSRNEYGVHTVNSEGDIIYIDGNNNIKKNQTV